MKKIFKLSALIAAMVLGKVSFAQLQDEQDVTMTMDLQPILQLSMEGPDQIDFTFDEINKYYTGVVKTGANILKVSASVSFDLWAVGVSTGSLNSVTTGLLWDNPVQYGTGITGVALNTIPLTALELHQFPGNPAIATCAGSTTANSDYSQQFAPFNFATNTILGGAVIASGNNEVFCSNPSGAYLPPLSTNGLTTTEKYIAGASSTTAGCQVAAGSWLFGSIANTTALPNTDVSSVANANAQQTAGGYYFVMDYRILPGLPAKFPSTLPANDANKAAPSVTEATLQCGSLNVAGNGFFAAPGVYTMFLKYILAEDQ